MVLPPMMPNDTIPPLLDRIASVTSTCVPQPWQYHSTLQAGLRPARPAPCRGATGKLRPHSIARLRWSTRACLHRALEFYGEVRNGADHRWPLLPQRLHGPLAVLGQPKLQQTNKQTNKQTTAAAVRHTQRPAPRLAAAPAAAAGNEQLCLLRVRVRVVTSRYSAVVCVCVCVRARVCVRVAVEGEDLIHQLIRRNLRFGQLQHVQLDHGVGDRLGRERAKLARPNRPSTTQRRPLQRFKPISARAGGKGGGGRSTGVRTVPHGMAVCNGRAARRMAVPV